MEVFGTTLDGKDILVYRPTTDGGGFVPLSARDDFEIVINSLTLYKEGDCFTGLAVFDFSGQRAGVAVASAFRFPMSSPCLSRTAGR